MSEREDELETVRLLVRLGVEAGGRVDPSRIFRRPKDSSSRIAYFEAQRLRWLDHLGYVTPLGRRESA